MRPLAEQEQANPGTVHDPEWFRRDVLPRLAGVKLAEIVEATGLSTSYASQVRASKFTPHVSTWAVLAGHRVPTFFPLPISLGCCSTRFLR
jgi:hypothetical protein